MAYLLEKAKKIVEWNELDQYRSLKNTDLGMYAPLICRKLLAAIEQIEKELKCTGLEPSFREGEKFALNIILRNFGAKELTYDLIESDIQTETITWHKSKKYLKADTNYLVHVLMRGKVEFVGDAYYTGAYWIIDREPFENELIIAWAELPKGWFSL